MSIDRKLISRLRWGVIGGVFGGAIALIGYFVLSVSTDSVFLFVLLRVVVGSVVAMIIGPILANRYPKSKPFQY